MKLALCMLTLVLVDCASLQRVARPNERAVAPSKSGPLATLEQAAAVKDASGFLVLDVNEDALQWRLALIDSATTSIDLMTFLWWGDEAGDLVLKRIIDAADRGVKVRLIVDDMTTIDDGKQLKLRDVSNAAIDAHPNIELRVFNPWANREALGRAVEFVGNFNRLNQRMHNKALIADNHAVIVGGRNLGNEYMGLSSTFNFRDLDVLGVGPVARQVSAVFDHFWNSDWAVPQKQLDPSGSLATLETERATLNAHLSAATTLTRFPLAPKNWGDRLAQLTLHRGTSEVVTDTTEPDALAHHVPAIVQLLFKKATREVLITNAYILPNEPVFEQTAADVRPGVRFAMLTNSLASTDAAGVHAHYTDWRPRLVRAGVELYELRHDARLRSEVVDTAPVSSGFVGLHAKAMVVDRQTTVIGSMNLDPRSWVHNSEMVLVIESAPLATQLAERIDRDLRPENAWRIEVDSTGHVTWVADTEHRTQAPERDSLQRLEESMHLLLPADLY